MPLKTHRRRVIHGLQADSGAGLVTIDTSNTSLTPAASNYENLQAAIWLQGNPPGYVNSHQGQISVSDPYGLDALNQKQGGSYVNR